MKRLTLAVILLFGCESKYENNVDDLERQIVQLKEENEGLREEINDLQVDIEECERILRSYEDHQIDPVVGLSKVDIEANVKLQQKRLEKKRMAPASLIELSKKISERDTLQGR